MANRKNAAPEPLLGYPARQPEKHDGSTIWDYLSGTAPKAPPPTPVLQGPTSFGGPLHDDFGPPGAPRPSLAFWQSLQNAPAPGSSSRQQLGNQAKQVARAGRGRDNAIAHVTTGELVLPQRLQTPEVMSAIARAALGGMQVGNTSNRINPVTGAPEFDDGEEGFGDDMAGWDDGGGGGSVGEDSGDDDGDTGGGATSGTDGSPNTPPTTTPNPMEEITVTGSPLPSDGNTSTSPDVTPNPMEEVTVTGTPCNFSMGNAPGPMDYARQGELSKMGLSDQGGGLYSALDLLQFRKNAPLDAQGYGADRAYGNYAFGVYTGALGLSLPGALTLADTYAMLKSDYKNKGYTMDPNYTNTPAANIQNIKQGYQDYQNNTLCPK